MKKIRGLEKWLTNDQEMINWVLEKLYNIGIVIPHPSERQDLRGDILASINKLALSPQGIDGIRKIRQDWNKKTYADKPENRTITFTLSPQTIHNLDRLRGKSSRRNTLEWLISLGYDIDNEMRTERREEIKKEKARLGHHWSKKRQLPPQEQRVANENMKLKSTNKAQGDLIENLLFKNTQLTELAKSHNLSESNLTTEQRLQAQENYDSLMEYHSRQIRADSVLKTEWSSGY